MTLPGFPAIAHDKDPLVAPGQEHISLFADRQIYIAGETVFFDLHLVCPDPHQSSQFAYLAVRGQHGVVTKMGLKIEGQRFNGAFYLPDTLSSGYYEIIAFTNWMRNSGEQQYAVQPIFVANRFDKDVKAWFKPELQRTNREPGPSADFQLLMKDSLGKRQKAVLDIKYLNPGDPIDYLTVSVVHSHAVHLEIAHSGKRNSGELGMIPGRGYIKERDYQVISGKVVSKTSGLPVHQARVILNTPDTVINIKYATTDEDGIFYFAIHNFYYSKELFFTADPSTTDNQQVEIVMDDKFNFLLPMAPIAFTGLEQRLDYILQTQETVRINKVYGLPPPFVAQTMEYHEPPARLFSRPVSRTFPSDYEPLDDLREIAREIITAWRIRFIGKDYAHSLIDQTTGNMLKGTPGLFVDGVITFSIRPLISMGSDQIREIQLLNRHWIHGDMHFPGIVSILTHHQEFLIQNHPDTHQIFFDAPCLPVAFQASSRGLSDNGLLAPDLRQLMYYEPNQRLNNDGQACLEWFTGDLEGNFQVVLRGFTKNGSPVFHTQSFFVQ